MSTDLKTKVANPGPLGLLGFGMTTVLLNLHNAGLLPLSIAIVAMGIALGGLAQIIAGIRELCQGNTFAGTAFTAYGLFWWSLVLIWVNPFAEANRKLLLRTMQKQGFVNYPNEWWHFCYGDKLYAAYKFEKQAIYGKAVSSWQPDLFKTE